MAEEVNYASVVFKAKGPRPEAEKEEDVVYDKVKINSNTSQEHPDTNAEKEEEIVYDEVKINSEKTQEHPDTNAKKEDEIVHGNMKIHGKNNQEFPETNAEKKEEAVYGEVKNNDDITQEHSAENAKKKEEIVYGSMKIHSETTEKHPDTNAGLLTDKEAKKRCRFQMLAYCFGVVCVILSLAVAGVFVYIASIHDMASLLRSNQTALQEENYNLTSHIDNLTSQRENLTRKLRDVIEQLNEYKNLTKSQSLLREEIKNLTAESKNLTNQKNNLEVQNQKLEEEMANLTGQIQNLERERENISGLIQKMTAELTKLDTSRAQSSIDAYCPKVEGTRTCQACEKGWSKSQSSCYAVNDHGPDGRRNWEGAQKDCRGKGSELVVAANETEKQNINDHSWASSGLHGYWIGLRAEHGEWKWVDGSDVADISWITGPVKDGQCVISVKSEGWKSVSCEEKQRWICEKAALSV